MVEMKIQKVGTRGYLFSFDEPYLTNLYVINGNKHLFICDTFLGPDPMREIIKYLENEGIKNKEIIIFNTHYDYDHIWGNQIFENSKIIAQELCIRELEKVGEGDLKQFEAHKMGDVKLVIPNTSFTEKLSYPEEGIEFYHSPGHTADSSSCYDSIDNVLIVGDNLESPFPYIRILNIDKYTNSLREYLSRDAKIIISGHDELMTDDTLLKSNLDYLEHFAPHKIDRSKFTKKHRGIHFSNVKTMGELLRNKGKKEEALEYYQEAAIILTEAEPTPHIDELKKVIKKSIDELTTSI
ncbi:MAG: MBL fold metallo-hydrolase [Candidatus Heimdallarchaeota archaeon]|nr:MBL fold metallo-hydrolase [Candidatus Heimdallarchaeota archaeon]